MYYVYKDGKEVFRGNAEEVAKKLKVSRALVRQYGTALEYTKNGYQIIYDDMNNQKKTWLNDDLIIKRINEGKTYEEIAKELKYPLPGFKQYCKAREYTYENKGHIEKKEIFYPSGYRQCPRCKKWFNNYAHKDWAWRDTDKLGHPRYYCSYNCLINKVVKWE